MSEPVPGARIRRRCPDCGARIEHGEDDGAVGCDFCGARLAIGAGDRPAAYAIAPASGSLAGDRPAAAGAQPPAPQTGKAGEARSRWVAAAKAALRTSGTRVRALESPRPLLAPFHRLRARAWQWYQDSPPPERAEMVWPHLSPTEGEGCFRLGIWDETTDALPSLRLGSANLGFRTQVFPWTPLADLLGPDPDSGPRPAVLPEELSAADARALLSGRLTAGWQLPPEEAREQLLVVTDLATQVMYAPLLVCPFSGPAGRAAILLDGITLRGGRLLTREELAHLESLEEAALDRSPEALPAGTLIPLSCPECSSPLPLLAHARVHRCTVCSRHWTVAGDSLATVPVVALAGGAFRRTTSGAIFLPFYRLRGPDVEWFAPATQGRSARATWNFALALGRGRRAWEEVDLAYNDVVSRAFTASRGSGISTRTARSQFSTGARPGDTAGPGIGSPPAIETPPTTAYALAPFIARCVERPVPASLRTELAWIAFEPRGPDFVEPGSGLGIPRRVFTPWDERRSAAGGWGRTAVASPARPGRPPAIRDPMESAPRRGS